VDRVGNFGPARYTSADIADKADEDRLALLEPHETTRLRSKYERTRSILLQEPDPRPEKTRRKYEG
jgi:hypothetical protein